MKSINTPVPGWELIPPAVTKDTIPLLKNITGKNDFVLNVDLTDSLIRLGIALALPILALLINKRLVIYTVPVIVYLFSTALIRFCVVKYVWHRYIRHDKAAELPAYGKDANYPEQSV